MTLLAVVVILSWLWMMATSFHLDDARTEVRRPRLLARQPVETAAAAGMRARLRRLRGGQAMDTGLGTHA